VKINFLALVVSPLIIGMGFGLVGHQSDLAPSSVVSTIAAPDPLLCFNETTKTLRESDVVTGCSTWERSLGFGPIQKLANRPNRLMPELEARFLAAQEAARAKGISLAVVSGFRSLERQTYLFNRAIKKYGSALEASKWVLPPEVSNHPWGLAIDVNYPSDPTSTQWLEVNGYKFGLCRAYENEWWHFEGLSNPGEKCPPMLEDASVGETLADTKPAKVSPLI
jgi:hypothetical protein